MRGIGVANLFILTAVSFGLGLIYWRLRRYLFRLRNRAYTIRLEVYEEDKLNKLIEKKSFDKFVFMLVDIDGFKINNETFSAVKVKMLLNEFVKITKGFLKKSDLFFRYKNDEVFALVFLNIGISEARETGSQLRRLIANHLFKVNHRQVNLSISIGITGFYKNDTAESIQKRAEQALNEANQSQNTVVLIEK